MLSATASTRCLRGGSGARAERLSPRTPSRNRTRRGWVPVEGCAASAGAETAIGVSRRRRCNDENEGVACAVARRWRRTCAADGRDFSLQGRGAGADDGPGRDDQKRFHVQASDRAGRMRRAFAIVGLLALALPVAVGASRIATGGLRTAIERAASPQLPAGVPQRCLVARVTTKGGRDWATVGFNVARATSCNRYGFDGVAVVRRVRGGWHYVTAGSSMIPCGKLGIASRSRHHPSVTSVSSCRGTPPGSPAG